MTRFTSLVEALPGGLPFLAPERLSERLGRPMELRLGANESPFGVAPGARVAMADALEQVAWYGDPESVELRREIGRRFGVAPETVSVGAGIDDVMGLSVRVLLEPGGVGVATAGGYPMFPFYIAGFGGRLQTTPYLSDGRQDLEALARLAHDHDARLVYLANPDNPSGRALSLSEVEDFLHMLPPASLLLLDQAYAELAPEASRGLPRDRDRVICLRTFSKAYGMAGARIGYALAPPPVIAAFDKVRAHFAVNRVAQAGALASLRDADFLSRVRRAVWEGLADYAELGRQLDIPVLPSATNFALFDLGSAARAEALMEGLQARGVFVRKPVLPPLARTLRVSVGAPEERRRLAEHLRQLIRGD